MAETIPYRSSIVAVINVKDFAAALAWYRDVLEMETVYTVDEIGWAEIATAVPNLTIGIQVDPENAGRAGGATLTLGVGDIELTKRTLESRGVKFDGDINVIPDMVKLATFSDPDGNAFMLAETLMDGAPA